MSKQVGNRMISLGIFLAMLIWTYACSRVEPEVTPTNNQTIDPTFSHSNQPRQTPTNIDEITLPTLLKSGKLESQFQQWDGRLFIARHINKMPPDSQLRYSFNAVYRDSNGNQFQDQADHGFFNPASTIKVGIAALVLEKLKTLALPREAEYQFDNRGPWFSIATDIQRAMVISDNEATNRLIYFLGFTPLNRQMRAKGLTFFSVNRLMLDRGTLVNSPPIRLRDQSTTHAQAEILVQGSYPCWEKPKTLGNCATSLDLIGIWLRMTHPQDFSPEQRFDLREGDRTWLLQTLSQTPKQAGFKTYADDYCRFLTGIEPAIVQPRGRLLSKCGVALFTHTFVDTSYIETNEGEKFVSVFAVSPPQSTSEAEIFDWMSQTMKYILPRLPKP